MLTFAKDSIEEYTVETSCLKIFLELIQRTKQLSFLGPKWDKYDPFWEFFEKRKEWEIKEDFHLKKFQNYIAEGKSLS